MAACRTPCAFTGSSWKGAAEALICATCTARCAGWSTCGGTSSPRWASNEEAPVHKSRLGNIVIDCQTDDLLSEAQFWSGVLGYPLPEDPDSTGSFIQL